MSSLTFTRSSFEGVGGPSCVCATHIPPTSTSAIANRTTDPVRMRGSISGNAAITFGPNAHRKNTANPRPFWSAPSFPIERVCQISICPYSGTAMNNGSHSPSVLVIDEQPAILAFFARILTAGGMRALLARNSGEAIGIAERGYVPIDLVLSNVLLRDDASPPVGRVPNKPSRYRPAGGVMPLGLCRGR